LFDNVLYSGRSDCNTPTAPTETWFASALTATGLLELGPPSTDNCQVTGTPYDRSVTSIGTTNGATTFNVNWLFQNTTYAFTVTAMDAAGKRFAAATPANCHNLNGGRYGQPRNAPR